MKYRKITFSIGPANAIRLEFLFFFTALKPVVSSGSTVQLLLWRDGEEEIPQDGKLQFYVGEANLP